MPKSGDVVGPMHDRRAAVTVRLPIEEVYVGLMTSFGHLSYVINLFQPRLGDETNDARCGQWWAESATFILREQDMG